MKPMSRPSMWRAVLGFLLLFTFAGQAFAGDPVSFRRAIELAIQHSGTMGQAVADQMEAHENYLEVRNAYLPAITVGSGLAYTYGFPMSLEGSAPSVFNVNTQQFLYNPAQQEYMRAAKTQWRASSTSLQEKRAQVILDTALVYTELDNLTSQVSVLRQQQQAATKALQVVDMRVQAGVDNELELTKTKLIVAQTQLRIAQDEGQVDTLRLRLAQLTGLAVGSIETLTESIPQLPQVQMEDVSLDTTDVNKIAESSPLVQAAMQKALAAEQNAKAEHKLLLYPQIDLAGQYGLFSKYNNYDQYFRKFQRNNAAIGLEIRVPLLNYAQRAKAEAADAAAIKARKQAEDVKDQLSLDAVKQKHGLQQLAAAREVARLEYLLARADVNTVGIRLTAGTANMRDQEQARVTEDDKYVTFLDANYDLDKAQMQYMKTTGELEQWALGNE